MISSSDVHHLLPPLFGPAWLTYNSLFDPYESYDLRSKFMDHNDAADIDGVPSAAELSKPWRSLDFIGIRILSSLITENSATGYQMR